MLGRVDLGQISVHVLLPEVDVLKQALPSLLHLDQATLQSLPELVVCGAAHVARVPNIVLYKLLDLVFPLGLEHGFFYRLNSDHQSVDVLDEDVITRDKKLLSATLAALTHSLQVGGGGEHGPTAVGVGCGAATARVVAAAGSPGGIRTLALVALAGLL